MAQPEIIIPETGLSLEILLISSILDDYFLHTVYKDHINHFRVKASMIYSFILNKNIIEYKKWFLEEFPKISPESADIIHTRCIDAISRIENIEYDTESEIKTLLECLVNAKKRVGTKKPLNTKSPNKEITTKIMEYRDKIRHNKLDQLQKIFDDSVEYFHLFEQHIRELSNMSVKNESFEDIKNLMVHYYIDGCKQKFSEVDTYLYIFYSLRMDLGQPSQEGIYDRLIISLICFVFERCDIFEKIVDGF